MEKKTKFKLKFVKNHLKNPRISKHSKCSHRCKKSKNLSITPSENSMIIFKYFNPIQFHRLAGDLVFLDKIETDTNEFVGLSSLWNNFKEIRDIHVSKNFIICNYNDSDQYTEVGLLLYRLKTLGNSESNDLADAINKYAEYFKSLAFSRKPRLLEIVNDSNQKEFDLCLKAHEKEPMLFYHYKANSDFKLFRNKIGANKILREMTFGDDIKLFEESLFVVPSNEYYQFMKNHLNICFNKDNDAVKMYMNTIIGVKTVYTICYNFLISNENVIVLTFPREIQSEEIKNLFDKISGFEVKGFFEEKKEQIIPKNFVYKNLDAWERLMKKYFEPWISNNEESEGRQLVKVSNCCSYLSLMGSDSFNNFFSLKDEEIS